MLFDVEPTPILGIVIATTPQQEHHMNFDQAFQRLIDSGGGVKADLIAEVS
jgi:hypothetical protein